MSQGMHDFVDAASESLRMGKHDFILVALQDRDAKGERTYHIRSGLHGPRDICALREILAEQVGPYLDNIEKEMR